MSCYGNENSPQYDRLGFLPSMHRGLLGVVAIITFEQCGPMPVPDATPSSTTRSSTAPGAALCLTPSDREGRPLYDMIQGTFVERRTDEGGGYFIVMKPTAGAANQSVVVTKNVYDALSVVERSRPITLFAYVTNAAAGTSPPYSCLQLADR